MEETVAATALVDLLNSRAYAGLPDKLDDPREAARVLRPFGQKRGVLSAERIALVRDLRGELVALANDDASDRDQHWSGLTRRTRDVVFRQEFTPQGGAQLRQVSGDIVVGGIILAVAELVAAGAWSRLKLCANDVCRAAFFDNTRSRTRRWHSYEMCGNRTNVAAHRTRAARSM
jgi:predicted RNA-binding Zn ribbon-like protein